MAKLTEEKEKAKWFAGLCNLDLIVKVLQSACGLVMITGNIRTLKSS